MMAHALPEDGELITCDIDPRPLAREFFAKTPHGKKIDLRVGPALDTIDTLDGPFDLVFIDADKTNYLNYYVKCIDLLSPRGVIAVDNTLWGGKVLDPKDESDKAIDALNAYVTNDPRVKQRPAHPERRPDACLPRLDPAPTPDPEPLHSKKQSDRQENRYTQIGKRVRHIKYCVQQAYHPQERQYIQAPFPPIYQRQPEAYRPRYYRNRHREQKKKPYPLPRLVVQFGPTLERGYDHNHDQRNPKCDKERISYVDKLAPRTHDLMSPNAPAVSLMLRKRDRRASKDLFRLYDSPQIRCSPPHYSHAPDKRLHPLLLTKLWGKRNKVSK